NITSEKLTVEQLISDWGDDLQLKLISGKKGLKRTIKEDRVQKIGLRMIEPDITLDKHTVQILGRTEVSYLSKKTPDEQNEILSRLTSQKIPCLIVTKGIKPPENLVKRCEQAGIPLLKTLLYTGKTISTLRAILEVRFAPFKTTHGVLMDIHRLGVLILGKSGIGKSECALDLVLRGAKLIVDDLVEIKRLGTSKLVGCSPQNIKHLMEIRGIGIINIKDLVGPTAVMDKREIDMVIELEHWDPKTEYKRVGDDYDTYNILDVKLPYLKIPVSPGRSVSTIVEIAVRNQIYRQSVSS
nr:HPr(Ser) kinase/phosphatase [Candidatus Dadabacteria bacterium]NIS10149.1 HPr(Ser) kinase/phosphatase [Candidatus Dadabacteria bacterium]NIV42500.1 HPr(Ser) kinase/phosphatase [Candidatus Dadabacteria bacterium]NIX16543.1 HPr(Ser) kinase/phosphatase [Candidatus Dadabacteria bacterium]NIY23063.1 HPr(Ser) kinase/phosphatase [Candidatus Dadabacteria bacterium]